MAHPSKEKGNRFERECVNICTKKHIAAKRAYGSNGESLGQAADVDMMIDARIKAQCKVRKRIAKWVKPPESCDITLVKEDRGEIYTVIRFKDYLELLKQAK